MNKKFTLIEILVVVAIIGILASLLLPALGKARKKAKEAVCKNNLKQLSTANFLYHDDNDGYYPIGPTSASGISWDDMLGLYDGRNLTLAEMQTGSGANGRWGMTITDMPEGEDHGPMYRCPSDTTLNTGGVLINYLPTQNNNDNSMRGIYGITSWVPPIASLGSKRVDDINKTSRTIVYTEVPARSNMGNSWEWIGVTANEMVNSSVPLHTNDYNFLKSDGSVESMTSLKSLVKDDGSIGGTGDIVETQWDTFR